MLKSAVTPVCLFASYFVIWLALYGYWGKAVAGAMLGTLVFWTALLAARLISKKPWRAFWIANIGLSSIIGGIEAYVWLTQQDPWADGHLRPGFVTDLSLANIVFDVVLWTIANLAGFALSRLVHRQLFAD